MDVILNGASRHLDDQATVATAVAAGAAGTTGVAVAVNDTVVPRAAWARTPLAPGDRVEVLVAMQGG